MSYREFAIALGLATSLLSYGAQAQQTSVFRIGQFDGSSGEFAQGEPRASFSFHAGHDPASAWYGFASIAFPGKPAEGAAAPRTISFDISGSPQRSYTLRISILIEQSSVPALRLQVNGHAGTFYLHPRLDYKMGDMVAAFDPAYSRAEVTADIPGAWLRAGANTLTLQAMATGTAAVPDAGFQYDALELTASATPPADSARAESTIFFRKRGGSLEERIDVFVRYRQHPHTGSVTLSIAGHTFTQPLHADQDFGEERISFHVPEFPAGTRAQLDLKLDGRSHHFSQPLDPQKKWTLFLVPHVHLDVGYSDYQAKVSAIQTRILDEAMDQVAKHPDFHFSMDGEWNLEQFLRSRTPAERQRIISAIRDKQIYVPAQFANELTGFPTAETLIRSLYPSAEFSRVHGTPFNYANITDVPSYSWSYASILAAARIPYFLAGSNNDRAPVLLQGHLNENSPFYWEGPDGGKVLMWYSRHYMQMQFLFGLPPLLPTGEEVLPLFLQMYEQPSYHASAAIIFGTQVENTDLFPQQGDLVGQWNAVHAYPHLEFSGFHDALDNIAHQFGSDIPTVRGDGGPYWEDGIGSDALYAAQERENESRAPSAEKLATIGTLVNPNLAVDRDELRSMWDNMVLMDEHTWLSWNSVSDPESDEAVQQLRVKDSRCTTASLQRDNILRNSMASLADSIAAGVGNLIVFNPLNWKNSNQVITDLDNGREIIDRSTGQAVPFLVLHKGPNYRKVEFRATDVPALGYKVYELGRATDPTPAPRQLASETLESPYYRVRLDAASGSIRSIFDKQLNRELVDNASPYRFGQYLYVSGGDQEPNSLLQYRAISPKPQLDIHPAANGRIVSVERTPWGMRAILESSTQNTPLIRTEIRLYDDEKKIELDNEVEKKSELKKEAVYFAFPFAMKAPQFQYEIQNGVVDPTRDMYAGAGREWFNVQHWVSVQQDGVSATVMPLDASLVTLGDINRGEWPTEFGRRPGSIFSYAMNNYWHTNYRAAQGGTFYFRYVVTSAAQTDAPALSRMGWQEFTPFEHDEIRSQDKALDLPRPLDGKEASFATINDPNVVLDTWKPAEDGNGTILRLIDLGGKARTITITTPLVSLEKVSTTDAVERDLSPIQTTSPHQFQVAIRPHQIVTVRLVGRP